MAICLLSFLTLDHIIHFGSGIFRKYVISQVFQNLTVPPQWKETWDHWSQEDHTGRLRTVYTQKATTTFTLSILASCSHMDNRLLI